MTTAHIQLVLKRSHFTHYYGRRRILLLVLPIIYFKLGSAFGPLIVPRLQIVSGMSTGNSCSNADDVQSSSTTPITTDTNDGQAKQGDDMDGGKVDDTTLLLPAGGDDPSIPTIRFGDTVSFEEMGPVIINTDGTTRRIDNWDQMSKQEQEVAWRRISKRNAERRAELIEKEKLFQVEERVDNGES